MDLPFCCVADSLNKPEKQQRYAPTKGNQEKKGKKEKKEKKEKKRIKRLEKKE